MSGRRSTASGDVGVCGRCSSVVPVDWCEDHRAYLCAKCAQHAAEVPVADENAAPSQAQSSASSQLLSSELASEIAPHSSFLAPCAKDARDAAACSAEQALEREAEVEQLLRLADAGELAPVAVELPRLPDGATPAMVKVVEFFRLVRGLRMATHEERDVPFAGRWVAQHVGLPSRSVYRILEALEAAGVLVRTGYMPPLAGRRFGTALYAPGVVPCAPVGVEGRTGVVGDALEPEAHLRDESLVFGAEVAAKERLARAPGSGAVVGVHDADRTPRGGGERASAADRREPGASDA